MFCEIKKVICQRIFNLQPQFQHFTQVLKWDCETRKKINFYSAETYVFWYFSEVKHVIKTKFILFEFNRIKLGFSLMTWYKCDNSSWNNFSTIFFYLVHTFTTAFNYIYNSFWFCACVVNTRVNYNIKLDRQKKIGVGTLTWRSKKAVIWAFHINTAWMCSPCSNCSDSHKVVDSFHSWKTEQDIEYVTPMKIATYALSTCLYSFTFINTSSSFHYPCTIVLYDAKRIFEMVPVVDAYRWIMYCFWYVIFIITCFSFRFSTFAILYIYLKKKKRNIYAETNKWVTFRCTHKSTRQPTSQLNTQTCSHILTIQTHLSYSLCVLIDRN